MRHPRLLLASLTLAAGLVNGGLFAGSQQIPHSQHAALDASPQPGGLSVPAADPVQGGVTPEVTQPATGTERTSRPGARARELRGNPLWAIPLRSLTHTRERPLFSPARRPPAPAVAGASVVESAQPPSPPALPDRPLLELVGAVSGEREGIAVFVDETTKDIVRLRTGESHGGWILQSVRGREATLQRDGEMVVLTLPKPGTGQRSSEPEL